MKFHNWEQHSKDTSWKMHDIFKMRKECTFFPALWITYLVIHNSIFTGEKSYFFFSKKSDLCDDIKESWPHHHSLSLAASSHLQNITKAVEVVRRTDGRTFSVYIYIVLGSHCSSLMASNSSSLHRLQLPQPRKTLGSQPRKVYVTSRWPIHYS